MAEKESSKSTIECHGFKTILKKVFAEKSTLIFDPKRPDLPLAHRKHLPGLVEQGNLSAVLGIEGQPESCSARNVDMFSVTEPTD